MKKKLMESLLALRSEIDIILNEVQANKNIQFKKDSSPITDFDLKVHNLFQELADDLGVHLLSEEGSHELKYPCFILDPLDGTKEFVAGIPECAVSFAYFNSADITDDANFAWIYNPFTREEINSEQLPAVSTRAEKTLVSRTEYKAGLHEDGEIKAVGSIAYKLLLLIEGNCNQVISKRPKNIWDIAAGTYMVVKSGGVAPQINGVLLEPELRWAYE